MTSNATLRSLTDRYLEGTASENDMAELSALLRDQPELQDEYLEMLDAHSALAWHYGTASRKTLAGMQKNPTVSPKFLRSLVSDAKKIRRVVVGFAVAASILIAVVWREGKTHFAFVTAMQNAEFLSNAQSLVIGQTLGSGVLQLNAGNVLLSHTNGARVALQGPAEIKLINETTIALQSGRVTVSCPQGAEGFTVQSNGFDVVDLGTEFGVHSWADEPGKMTTEVHVFGGLVKVKLPQASEVPLRDGEGLRFHEDGEIISIDAVPDDFIDPHEWQATGSLVSPRFSDAARIQDRMSGDANAIFDVAFTSENLHGGQLIGGEWTEGRSPGQKSIAFGEQADCFEVQINARPQQVTFAMWLRIDHLPSQMTSQMTSLMTTNQASVGSCQWLVTPDGEIRLEIGRDLGRSELDWEAVSSQAVLTPDQLGKWCFLATSFDGQRIIHYYNGKECGSGPSFRPKTLSFGAVQIGNGLAPSQAPLNGVVSEFVIFDGVISAHELARYFRAASR
ncbi:MAG: LamG domain-containing protein [Pirellulaceae bacterium]|nr:LamG domain-containing protein [Pirellulaceae bacterium]